MSSSSHPPNESAPQTNAGNTTPPASTNYVSAAGWLIVFSIVAIAAVVFAIGRGSQSSSTAAVGQPAPILDVIPLTGGAQPIASVETRPAAKSEAGSFEGITLLHFWGTWCPPCRMEYPELVDMVQEFTPDDEFRFVSISCEASAGESTFEMLQQETESFYESIGVDVPTYCDPAGRTRQSTAAVLGNPGLYYPSTLLIDRDGKIARVWEGFTPSGVRQMRKAIAAELENA